jgi:hypothetical protein
MEDDMDQKTYAQMERLVRWFSADYQEWIKAAREKSALEGKELFFTDPSEADYAIQRLGVNPSTFSRWKNLLNPINKDHVLLIAVNTGSIEPLTICEYGTLPDDLKEIIVHWRQRTPEERKNIKRLATMGGSPSQNISPINGEA